MKPFRFLFWAIISAAVMQESLEKVITRYLNYLN